MFVCTGNSILHSAADSVSSAVLKASQALNERGERLGRVEEKTGDMMNSAHQFADTAHKVQHSHSSSNLTMRSCHHLASLEKLRSRLSSSRYTFNERLVIQKI